jgi:hypothetical protein
MDLKNLAVIRQSFGCAVYTHKVHEVSAEIEHKQGIRVAILNIILVTLVLGVLVWQLFVLECRILTYVAAGLSVAEVTFLLIQLTFNFSDRERVHKTYALRFRDIREKYICLISDIMSEKLTNKEIVSRRDYLQEEFQKICELSPQTARKAYSIAQERLNPRGSIQGEDFTFTNEELDRFLPIELRLKNKK